MGPSKNYNVMSNNNSFVCVREVNAACGDGVVQTGEMCDDGNDNESDGCTSLCRPPECGDAIVSTGEQCDDGNDNETDDCTSACEYYSSCGDGVVQFVEQCDDDGSYPFASEYTVWKDRIVPTATRKLAPWPKGFLNAPM